jgi:hypothetical protein
MSRVFILDEFGETAIPLHGAFVVVVPDDMPDEPEAVQDFANTVKHDGTDSLLAVFVAEDGVEPYVVGPLRNVKELVADRLRAAGRL